MTTQDVLVWIVVGAAFAYVVRRWIGPRARPRRAPRRPDVPLRRLVRSGRERG